MMSVGSVLATYAAALLVGGVDIHFDTSAVHMSTLVHMSVDERTSRPSIELQQAYANANLHYLHVSQVPAEAHIYERQLQVRTSLGA